MNLLTDKILITFGHTVNTVRSRLNRFGFTSRFTFGATTTPPLSRRIQLLEGHCYPYGSDHYFVLRPGYYNRKWWGGLPPQDIVGGGKTPWGLGHHAVGNITVGIMVIMWTSCGHHGKH